MKIKTKDGKRYVTLFEQEKRDLAKAMAILFDIAVLSLPPLAKEAYDATVALGVIMRQFPARTAKVLDGQKDLPLDPDKKEEGDENGSGKT